VVAAKTPKKKKKHCRQEGKGKGQKRERPRKKGGKETTVGNWRTEMKRGHQHRKKKTPRQEKRQEPKKGKERPDG